MTTPPDHSHADDSMIEAAVDDLGQRAGASLRRPAPEDGAAHVMKTGAKIRRRRTTGAAVGVGLLAIGTFVLVKRSDGSETRTVTSVPPPVTEPAASSSPTPSTAASTTTVGVTRLDARLDQWALDYTGGTAGPATGAPVRIGISGVGDVSAMQATATYLNTELGGIGGRPVELVNCDSTFTDAAVACASRFADDPTISLVISGVVDAAFVTTLGTSKPRFGGGASGDEGTVSYDLGGTQAAYLAMAKLVRQNVPIDGRPVVLYPYPNRDALAPLLDGYGLVQVGDQVDANGFVDALNAQNAADAGAVLLVGRPSHCDTLRDAVAQLGTDPIVITAACPHGVEGWYYVGASYNPDEPSYETGAATGVAVLKQYGNNRDPGDSLYDVANLMTAAKIINSVGGPDAATVEVLNQALVDFTGPAMLTGEQDCSLIANADPARHTFPLSCQKTMSVLQFRDGKYVELQPIDITTP